MTDTATGAAPAAAEPAAIANTQTADPMASITQTMSDAYDKINPPRENGRFVAKDKPEEVKAEGAPPSDAAKETPDLIPAEAQVEPSKTAIDPPLSWSAEMKAKWATLSPDVQAYAAQREGEAHKRISELGQQVKSVEPIRQLIEPLRQASARYGVSEGQALQRLVSANDYLERDPAAAIAWLAQAYGVDLPGGQQAPGEGQESGHVRALQARINTLERTLGETANKVTARERSEQERAQASLTTLIENFSKDKADIAEIEADVAAQIRAILQQEPNLPPDKILERAYEAARWANPNARAKLLAEQEKTRAEKLEAENKKKATEAKRSGSLNVRSTSATPARKGGWEDTLREVGERIAG